MVATEVEHAHNLGATTADSSWYNGRALHQGLPGDAIIGYETMRKGMTRFQ